jgi:uncharacterized protein YukE
MELSPIEQNIQNKIFTIRNMQDMFDRDLAKLYQVNVKVFNQAVKRNIEESKDETETWLLPFC